MQRLACAQTVKLDCLVAKIHKFYWSPWIKNGLTFKDYMHQCFLWHSSCSTVLVNEILLRCASIEEANLESQRLSYLKAKLKGFSLFCWNSICLGGFFDTNLLSFFLFSTGCWYLPVYIQFLVLYSFHSELLFPPYYFSLCNFLDTFHLHFAIYFIKLNANITN